MPSLLLSRTSTEQTLKYFYEVSPKYYQHISKKKHEETGESLNISQPKTMGYQENLSSNKHMDYCFISQKNSQKPDLCHAPYHPRPSANDANSTALHKALSHLEKRMLFVDYSSAFNAIVTFYSIPT